MTKIIPEEEQAHRATDGFVAFGVAALALATFLLVMLDRIGAPAQLTSSLGPLGVVFGLVLIGVLARGMRISRYYAAGRGMPAPFAALAMAALAIAIFLPFMPPDVGEASAPDLIAGFGGGALIAVFLTGPLLRKTGAFSLPDLFAARFPQWPLRLGVVAVVCVVSLCVALAAFETAVRELQVSLQWDRGAAVALAAAAVICMVLPGGLSGVVWTSLGAAMTFLAGLALPIAVLLAHGAALPLPAMGDAAGWSAASARIASWLPAGATGFHPIVMLALAIGMGALAPALAPSIATTGRVGAHRAGRAAIVWILVFAALVVVTIFAAANSVDAVTVGRRLGDLPDLIYRASAHGLVSLCGQAVDGPLSALADCVARPGFQNVLRASDISARGAFLLTALPGLRDLGASYVGLASAGKLAITLTLAAAGLHSFATALGHDLMYRLGAAGALTSRRLAITRGLVFATVVACGAYLLRQSVDTRELTALAAALSTAALAPVLLLTFWPRATSLDAIFALLGGLASAEIFTVLFGGAPKFDALMTGAMASCLIGAALGFIASLFRAPDPLRGGGAFFDRVFNAYGEVVNPDRGA